LKKLLFILILLQAIIFPELSGQNITISLPPMPPANTANWASGGNMFTITVSGTGALAESRILVYIKTSSGQVVCGSNQPATAQPTNIKPGSPKAWAGQAALSLLGDNCVLPNGSFELCVQIIPIKNQGRNTETIERCVPFEIRPVECTAPTNVTPATNQILTTTDILKPISFIWTPLIMSAKGIVTYRLMLWEVEDGQTMFEALYNNYPLIIKDIKGTTKYMAPPNTFERRNAKYVWRVTAINENERLVCKNAQSEPTMFSVNMPEMVTPEPPKDSTSTKYDSCCANKIVDKGKTVAVSPANVASISQQFNISPVNIKYLSAEIVSVKESTIDTACMKCATHEDWIYNFISPNSAAWNGGTAWNASPVNNSTYYPSKMIEWHCNQQGNLLFKFKIPLPENKSGCNRKSTICIRYRFTDENCVSCEQIICYEISN